ncbi:MAG: dihydrodipicolinate reductase [Acidobacteria bacterium]|nr:dihydrodipicolinate reductase [Acidobacteriota bacterium]
MTNFSATRIRRSSSRCRRERWRYEPAGGFDRAGAWLSCLRYRPRADAVRGPACSRGAAVNVAIVGYGKMGKLIDQLAPEYGCEVKLRLDVRENANQESITRENFREIQVAIEFSAPEAAIANIERLAAIGVNTVVGTTGWTGQLDRARAAVEQHGTALVWSPNYSVGVNVFLRLTALAAKLLAEEKEYGAWAWEIHHITKKDAPSGTLLKLVEEMKKAGYARPIDVGSNRAGAHPGTHEMGFDSAADTITLRHAARSREGFARGALKAARWIEGRRGFYEFSEVLFG